MRRALIATVVLLASCGRSAPEGQFVLRVGVTGPLEWSGPRTRSGGAMPATDLVYESVLAPTGGTLTSPFLRSWERTGGGRWRLEFKPGRRFSDGRPVTAEDLARSLRARQFRVELDGDVLLAESGSGAGGLADLLLVPVANGDGAEALGTGPFALAEASPGLLRLRRLERRPGGVDTVELVGLESPREAFSLLLRGKLNAVSPLDRAQAELLEGIPGIQVVSGSGPNATVAFLNPRRLPLGERRDLAASVPAAEVAALAGLGGHCRGPAPARALPAGRPLRIGYLALWEETRRAALGLRRALGTRGGELVAVTQDEGRVATEGLDVLVKPALVWPSAMLASTLASGSPFNPFGYANAAFDAATLRGDDAAAAAALQDDPALILICRRERIMAVDARIQNAALSAWGIFDGLPEWGVSP